MRYSILVKDIKSASELSLTIAVERDGSLDFLVIAGRFTLLMAPSIFHDLQMVSLEFHTLNEIA